jgi:hypothetical protein
MNIYAFQRYFLCLLCALLPLTKTVAQEIVYSAAQRFATQVTEYDVAGLTDQGVLLHKWGNHYSIVEVLDERDLSVKWSKELRFDDKPRAQVRYLTALRNEVAIFYTIKQKRYQYLYVRLTDSRLEPIGKDILLDSLKIEFGIPTLGWQFLVSPNQSHLALLRYNSSFSNLESLDAIILSRDMEVRGKPHFDISDKNGPMVLKSYLSNEGEMWLCVGDKRHRLSGVERYERYELLGYRYADGFNRRIVVSDAEHDIGSLSFQADLQRKSLVVAGFYTERGGNSSAGFFRAEIGANDATASNYVFTPFKGDFLKQADRALLVAKNELLNLVVTDIAVRHDGGILLLGESFFTSQQTIMRSAFESFSSRVPDQITSYHHNDMVALSINPDGSEHWSRIIQKKQFSEDDGGYYSSYATLNLKSAVHLIFNEEIRYDTKTTDCTLDMFTGDYRMLGVPGNKQQNNVLAAPRYARQLWANGLIFPAFTNRNEFLLAKISF